MDVSELLGDVYGRVDGHVRGAVEGLDPALLTAPPGPGTNPIGWLLWHGTRVMDHHLAELTGGTQEWVTGDWAQHFGVAADADDTGYGHTAAQVAALRPQGVEAVTGYHEAVAQRMRTYLAGLDAAALDRVVDTRWDPPVTLGVRLVSIADDQIQHAGQAAYARGILERS